VAKNENTRCRIKDPHKNAEETVKNVESKMNQRRSGPYLTLDFLAMVRYKRGKETKKVLNTIEDVSVYHLRETVVRSP